MKKAFVFPGQGSQKAGMGLDLYQNIPESKAVFDAADRILGFSISKICFEGPEDKLKLTEISQPAILTTSIAILAAIKSMPDIAAGHSLGEYCALVCAKAITFEDALRLVRLRGKFMQEASPAGQGSMAAVLGISRDKLVECLKAASAKGIVEAANFNSPGQIVISGQNEAVAEAGRLLKEAGAKKIIPLAVSAPFHSSLMQSAADKLAAELNKISVNDPVIPVVSNVTASAVIDAKTIRPMLIKQVTGSVLWEDSINEMVRLGVDTFVEVGPGNVLAGLIKKTAQDVKISGVNDMMSLKEFNA